LARLSLYPLPPPLYVCRRSGGKTARTTALRTTAAQAPRTGPRRSRNACFAERRANKSRKSSNDEKQLRAGRRREARWVGLRWRPGSACTGHWFRSGKKASAWNSQRVSPPPQGEGASVRFYFIFFSAVFRAGAKCRNHNSARSYFTACLFYLLAPHTSRPRDLPRCGALSLLYKPPASLQGGIHQKSLLR
jgi:hypothetical protein